ncbi:thyrotropin-releasing hormone receptor-like isoform X1 [Diabrotica virgifera virgifera]|uniref:G-protein coupled receptors family 1 profile domain-containing protein n=1 Tax=Diabrotica virgifera virgifera TaxID=50390 RepID=A0ABM5L423_DIAVI|nr:thyrotropin-releasing hormone receptor-like isoform X1 [Diabrotica virgifera virgifera]
MDSPREYFQTPRSLLYVEEQYLMNETSDVEKLLSCAESSYGFANYMDFLHLYYIPVIIVTGFLGNLTSCVVLLCTHLKLRSSSYYLAALALADSGYLLCLLVLYCSSNNFIHLYNMQGICQMCIYLTYVFSFLSVWLIVAFTIERFIAVQYPLKKPYICTAKRAKKIVSGLGLVAFLLYIFAFWITDVIDNECQLKPKYINFMEVFNYVDTTMTLVLPVIMIVGMNIMIARSLFKLRKYMQTRMADEPSPRQFDLYPTSSSRSSSSTKKSKDQHNSQDTGSYGVEKIVQKRNRTKHEKYSHIHVKKSTRHTASYSQHSINRMLLVISSVFIGLNFPSYMVRLSINFDAFMKSNFARKYFDCVQQFAMVLFYTNFSINFLLYTMCGKAFRLCLKTFLCNICEKIVCVSRRNQRSFNV